MEIAREIKKEALRLGFDIVGITDSSPIDAMQIEFLNTWLKSGLAGQMAYMHRNLEKRIAPARLLDNAQSVIVVGLNYTRKGNNQIRSSFPTARISDYACYEDYHPFIKERLYKLVEFIKSKTEESFKFKVCVDSVPLAERALAARAGLGFIGKNHMLINPDFGCKIFLGEIITTLKLRPDKPVNSERADCNKCIEACPTGALRTDGQFDAGKCISYLTIEYKGKIPPDLAKKMGDHLFGCDECSNACPYQAKAPTSKNKQLKYYSDRAEIDIQEILNMTEESFNTKFADSTIIRTGLDRLKRNAKICLENQSI